METEFNGNIVSSIWGIISVLVTFALYYVNINKKLDLLIRPIEVCFNKNQALDFMRLYVEFMKAEVNKYGNAMIIDLVNIKVKSDQGMEVSDTEILEIFGGKMNDIRGSMLHIRGLITNFSLVKEMHFRRFMENQYPIIKPIIEESSKEVMGYLSEWLSGSISFDGLRMKINQHIDKNTEVIHDLLKTKIEALYP